MKFTLYSNVVGRYKTTHSTSEKSTKHFYAKDAQFRPAELVDWSECADAQADFSLRWAHMSEGTFSHVQVVSTLTQISLSWERRLNIFGKGSLLEIQKKIKKKKKKKKKKKNRKRAESLYF